MRKRYQLTDKQMRELSRLPEDDGAAWDFWGIVAYGLGVDAGSIVALADPVYNTPVPPGIRGRFTALPLGHGKHWCYPYSLKCKNPVPPEQEVRQ